MSACERAVTDDRGVSLIITHNTAYTVLVGFAPLDYIYFGFFTCRYNISVQTRAPVSSAYLWAVLLSFLGSRFFGEDINEDLTKSYFHNIYLMIFFVTACASVDTIVTSNEEESGTALNLDQANHEIRNGARLVLSYDQPSNAFKGYVENTTDSTLKQVRVEVH